MSDDSPKIGYDHPTTDVSEPDTGLHKVEGVVYVHEDGSRELAGLEYDGVLVPADTAMRLYDAELDDLYGGEFDQSGMDSGVFTWEQVRQVIDG